MTRLLLPTLIFFTQMLNPAVHQSDFSDDIAALFKSGNSKEIAKSFASSVELSIINEEDVYSKAQAEQILRDFFIKYPPTNSAVVHLIKTNPNYRFEILSLTTKNGKFRVSITSKKTGSAFLITEIRIEPDNK